MAVRLNCFDDGTLLLMVGVFTPFTPEDSDEARPPENNVKLTKRNRSLGYNGFPRSHRYVGRKLSD